MSALYYDFMKKHQIGLISRNFHNNNLRLLMIRNVFLAEKKRILSTHRTSMKHCGDSFVLGSDSLLLFTYDNLAEQYTLAADSEYPNLPYLPHCSKFFNTWIDITKYTFTYTLCSDILLYGDPQLFKVIDQIDHPGEIGQHNLCKNSPFIVVAAGYDDHIYISDFRTGAIMTSFSRKTPRFKSGVISEHSVSWSPSCDRLICSVMSDKTSPIKLFDVRQPKTDIGVLFDCDYQRIDSLTIPFVNFLDRDIGKLLVSFVNDSHVRIWDITTGALIQTITRESPVEHSAYEYIQPAILPLQENTVVFVPNKSKINVHTCSEAVATIEELGANINLLQFSKLRNHIIGISDNDRVCIWQCGKSLVDPDYVVKDSF